MVDNVVNATDMVEHTSVSMSVGSLILQADIVVKGVILLLLIASVWSWAIIFEKWKLFRSHKERIGKFEQAYRATKELKSFYQETKKQIDNPMAAMFMAAMYEATEGVFKGTKRSDPSKQQRLKERIFYAIHRVKGKALERMEHHLIVLATVGGAAPFVGLFGTVWGIVNSFQAIAATKNTTLAVVAPGIAEALLATGIGLFAAIPAVIFYNFYSNEIRRMSIRLEDFSGEISSVLAFSIESE